MKQGEVYWLDLGRPSGSEPDFLRPYIVVQNDLFNASDLRTTVVCALTSRLKWAASSCNVRLEPGEAHLPKASVVNVTQLFTASFALKAHALLGVG